MKKRKLKIKEGDVFAVPIEKEGFCIGLIAREYKGIALGYFFNRKYLSPPEELDGTNMNNWKVALIGKFSSLAIENGEWPLLRVCNFEFKREEWPIPVLKMQHPITEQYFAVLYDDTLINEERHKITKKEADELFGYGLFGYKALEKQLISIFTKNIQPE